MTKLYITASKYRSHSVEQSAPQRWIKPSSGGAKIIQTYKVTRVTPGTASIQGEQKFCVFRNR
jgi:hypothetical protein